ncbi:MAG: Uma2 family endonuclease [Candidatus Contendobacter sp.]
MFDFQFDLANAVRFVPVDFSQTTSSASTEAYDLGDKFAHYRRLPSLMEYVLIAQNKVRVEHYIRQDNKWVLTEMNSLDETLYLASIQCEIALRDIYAKVDLAIVRHEPQ